MDKAREAATMDYASDGHSMGSGDLPPPAYRTVTSENVVKIAKLAAMTLIAVSVIIGFTVLVAAYIQSNSDDACPCLTAETLPIPQGLRKSLGGELEGSASSPSATKSPFNLQFDGDTGRLLKNSNKANVNCVVERKRATQIITHDAKTIVTPFGNMTSDPRLVHVVGEKMTFTCNSGSKKDKHATNRIKRETGMCSCNCAC